MKIKYLEATEKGFDKIELNIFTIDEIDLYRKIVVYINGRINVFLGDLL